MLVELLTVVVYKLPSFNTKSGAIGKRLAALLTGDTGVVVGLAIIFEDVPRDVQIADEAFQPECLVVARLAVRLTRFREEGSRYLLLARLTLEAVRVPSLVES